MKRNPDQPIKGRGAVSNSEGRFESLRVENVHDGWDLLEELPSAPQTTVSRETAKSIISRNESPDIPYDQSINPYRGCEHGCIYCFARPTHSYLNLSPGLDFETKLFYKHNAAELLEKELSKPGYVCSSINLGSATDPYQPIEKKLMVTRSLLEVLARFQHPATVLTKSAMVERDIDLLAEMAQKQLVSVAISITSLRDDLKRTLEPRAASVAARFKAVRRLRDAGIPVFVLFAPVIPFVNDSELEEVIKQAAEAGAQGANYVFLRLPHELKEIFREWLQAHVPQKAEHVMSLVQQSRGGKDYDSEWGQRMRGQGVFADLIKQRFLLTCRRHQLQNRAVWRLDTTQFKVPPRSGDQMGLGF
ncbi:PA0069 family radical SAM protein [Stenotrophobium rhamnosiphilum]|uniref:PA0069 family radical SAM protein n=1 Tax=Stenotrophobium rhamnosiphilum TaxID=2029166 RepID=UPI0019CF94DF|nr:PA0069 family radical SAM protein [Stenotrophobium rhamnosiphilum]